MTWGPFCWFVVVVGMTSEVASCVPVTDVTTSGEDGSEDSADLLDPDGCLIERKYWCFLLSSICTFLAGLLIVLIWRAFAFLCCRADPEYAPNDPKQKEQKQQQQRGKQEFEGTFMTEAKDWAGELISGQTTTGRILVSRTSSQSNRKCHHYFLALIKKLLQIFKEYLGFVPNLTFELQCKSRLTGIFPL